MVPDTLRLIPELSVNVLFDLLAAKVIDAQAAFAETVTLWPPLIITTSPATGTPVPLQVASLFQFPLLRDV